MSTQRGNHGPTGRPIYSSPMCTQLLQGAADLLSTLQLLELPCTVMGSLSVALCPAPVATRQCCMGAVNEHHHLPQSTSLQLKGFCPTQSASSPVLVSSQLGVDDVA
jgi:hypothetical protein